MTTRDGGNLLCVLVIKKMSVLSKIQQVYVLSGVCVRDCAYKCARHPVNDRPLLA